MNLKPLLLSLLLAASAPLHASTLSDLRTALRGLQAKSPLHATYELQRHDVSQGRFYNGEYNASASADVRIDSEGLSLHFDPAALDRARNERVARLGGLQRDQKKAIVADIPVSRVAEMLDFAPPLNAMLGRSELLDEHKAVYAGQEVQVLVLKLGEVDQMGLKGRVKQKDDQLTLWVGADHLPVAAERTASYTAGILFLHGDNVIKEKWTFARRNDRLVAVRHERRDDGAGMGETTAARETDTVTLR